MDEKTALAYAITKGLAYTENGGKPAAPRAGKTGEMKSIFQFQPSTWKMYAKEILGNENAPINADNETYVVSKKVHNWLDKGFTAKQIASAWNAGESEKDAYTGKFSTGRPSVGMNKKYNVKYDVPNYANSVANYAKKFYTEEFQNQISTNGSSMINQSS